MKRELFFFGTALLLLGSCSKKSPDTPVAMVPERIVINPDSKSVLVGDTAKFSITYFTNFGNEAAAPAGIIWTSNDTSIATVTQQGIANGISAGQVEIKARYNNSTAKTLLTVAANASQTATVEILQRTHELKLNESFTLTAVAKDVNGNTIIGKTFSWQTDSALYASIDAASGIVTAKGYGTASITVSTDGIRSSPAMVQVIRTGNFGQASSKGAAKLKIENGVLKLQTTADFSVAAGPPDLRIYLGNNNNNVNGAVEIALLSKRDGLQSWNVPNIVNITQYRYVIVWCKQLGGIYGVADLGN